MDLFSDNYLQFNGNIHYHNSIHTTHDILQSLLDTINSQSPDLMDNKIVVGVDCEWPVFRGKASKVALIQLCIDSDECHLFHISAMNYTIPPLLVKLLLHHKCLKVGLNIEADLWKLQRDYDLPFDSLWVSDHKSIIDLKHMANKLLDMNANWSLSRLCEHLLSKPICKQIRLSNWSQNPLSSEQLMYAAIDAFASYQLYFEIKANAITTITLT